MKKILLVEDDIFLRQIISKRLLDSGYDVVTVISGKDALGRIVKDKPDLVLLDILLPEMDGFEILKKARENKDISNIPIAVLSNLTQQSDIDKALNLGAVDYFIKSQFTSEEVEEKIKALLK
jgi:DNA-binding response OmpR family regulator